jgi:hypothetical protein
MKYTLRNLICKISGRDTVMVDRLYLNLFGNSSATIGWLLICLLDVACGERPAVVVYIAQAFTDTTSSHI